MIMAVQQKVKTRKHKCPPHHFIIDSGNVGHCKYCPEVRDFGELLVREGQYFKKAGRRGAKVSKVARNPYSRRGRRPKYE